jgi:predicted membrane-bound mannosyltransferase
VPSLLYSPVEILLVYHLVVALNAVRIYMELTRAINANAVVIVAIYCDIVRIFFYKREKTREVQRNKLQIEFFNILEGCKVKY